MQPGTAADQGATQDPQGSAGLGYVEGMVPGPRIPMGSGKGSSQLKRHPDSWRKHPRASCLTGQWRVQSEKSGSDPPASGSAASDQAPQATHRAEHNFTRAPAELQINTPHPRQVRARLHSLSAQRMVTVCHRAGKKGKKAANGDLPGTGKPLQVKYRADSASEAGPPRVFMLPHAPQVCR